MSEMKVVRDPVLGEEVWLGETGSGLPVRVVETDRFREFMAVVTFNYGSIDLGFRLDGEVHHSPEGVAHYLEHKLFEDEELQVFDRFARRGARVNAMTGFGQTTYYFSATSQFADNLKDLLHLVSEVHITDENVEKERGIIAQEIRMYEDSPDYRSFFDFLGALYQEHPVRHPVGGTVESIQEISRQELLACYRAFYRTGNAALCVVGPVSRQLVMELAEACALPSGQAPTSLCSEDLGPVARNLHLHRRQLEVSRPRVVLGFKDRSLCKETEARLRRELLTRILLDSLFGASSDARENLRRQGLVDDTLSASYICERSFGVTALGCETEEPDRTIEVLKKLLFAKAPLSEDHLERVRRKVLGQYVRSFASVKTMAFAHAREALEGVAPFSGLERMMSIEVSKLQARQEEHFSQDAFAAAIIDALPASPGRGTGKGPARQRPEPPGPGADHSSC